MNIFDGNIGQSRLRIVGVDRIFLQELRGEVIEQVTILAEVIHLTEGFEGPILLRRPHTIFPVRFEAHIGEPVHVGIVEKHFALGVQHYIKTGFTGSQALSAIVIDMSNIRLLGITPTSIQHALQFRFGHIHIDHIVADQHIAHIPFVSVRTVFRSAVFERLRVKFHEHMVVDQVHERSITIAARIAINIVERHIIEGHFRRLVHIDQRGRPVIGSIMLKTVIADGNRLGTDHMRNHTMGSKSIGRHITAQIHVVHVAVFTGPFQIVTDKVDEPAGLTTRIEADILDHIKVCIDRQVITVKGDQRTAGTHFFRVGGRFRFGTGNTDILETYITEQFQICVPHVDRTAFAVNNSTQIVGTVKTQIPDPDIDIVSVNRFFSDRVIDLEEALTVLFLAGSRIGNILERQRIRIVFVRTTFDGNGFGNIQLPMPYKDTIVLSVINYITLAV